MDGSSSVNNSTSSIGTSVSSTGKSITGQSVTTQSGASFATAKDILQPATTSLQSYNGVAGLNLPVPSIVDFSKSINSAIDTLSQQIYRQQEENDLSLNNLFQANVSEGQIILKTYNQIAQLAQQAQNIYNQAQTAVANLNSSVNTNASSTQVAADNAAVSAIQTAITTYNSSGNSSADKTAYQNAVNTYNAYVASRAGMIGQLNGDITSYNQTVSDPSNPNAIDSEIAAFNEVSTNTNFTFPTLSTLNTYPPSSYPLISVPSATDPSISTPTQGYSLPAVQGTFPHVSIAAPQPSPLPTATNPIDPINGDLQALVNKVFLPFYNQFVGNVANNTSFFDLLSNFQGYLQFVFKGLVPTLPSAYTDYREQVYANEDTGAGSGSGVSLASIINGLKSPELQKLLDRSVYADGLAQELTPIDPHVVDQVAYQNLQLLVRSGLYSGTQALSLLFDKLPFIDVNASPTAVAVGLGFANQLAFVASNNKLKTPILNILKANYPTAKPSELEQPANVLTAASNLFLSQVGLFSAAKALGQPQLVAQVASTFSHASDLQGVLAKSQNNDIQEVYNDRLNEVYLKSALANHLVDNGILNSQQASTLASGAISKALQDKNVTTSDQLHGAVVKELTQSGLSQSHASSAADLVAAYSQADIDSRNQLNIGINADSVKNERLQNALSAQNIDVNFAASAVASSLNAHEHITQRTLRDRLTQSLVNQGVSRTTALAATTKALVNVLPPPPAPVLASVTLPELKNEVSANVINLLTPTLGNLRAENVANQYVATLLGSETVNEKQQSLREIADKSLDTFHSLQNAQIANVADDSFRDSIKPTFNLYDFTQKLLNPANTLLLTLHNGITYPHRAHYAPSAGFSGRETPPIDIEV